MANLSLIQTAPTVRVAIIIFMLSVGSYPLGHRIRINVSEKIPLIPPQNPGAVSGTLFAL